jgi:hypothetical protein
LPPGTPKVVQRAPSTSVTWVAPRDIDGVDQDDRLAVARSAG